MIGKRSLCGAIAALGLLGATVALAGMSVEPTTPNSNPSSAEPFPNGGTTGEGPYNGTAMQVLAPSVQKAYGSFTFDDNAELNDGFRFIPPDPMGAASHSRLVAVVNTMIESRNFGGKLKWRTSLRDFFSPLGEATLGTYTFDPKIVYDRYEDRFVVVTLEQTQQNPTDESRLLVAVSKDGTPQTPGPGDWYYYAIDSKVNFPGTSIPLWADYPGLEVDEEAVYVTSNAFTFASFGGFFYGGSFLWIIDKGVAGGLYDGGMAAVSVHEPCVDSGAFCFSTTQMPAEVNGGGIGGPGSTIGTYLVAYSGITDGGPNGQEYYQVIEIDDPLGTAGGPFFTPQFVPLGDVEDVGNPGFPALPDAPQADSSFLIEVNDRRVLDAVWQDGSLYAVTTVLPIFGPPETTAFWAQLDTTGGIGNIVTADAGLIDGEDIAPNTTTFFPSVAVNVRGDAMFGFSASAATIYGGAFAAGRATGDPAGTVRATQTIKAGEGPYKRYFSGPRNRWGDYSGICVDPSNDRFFWVFNEYADIPGSPGEGSQGPEDGRWATAWGRVKGP